MDQEYVSVSRGTVAQNGQVGCTLGFDGYLPWAGPTITNYGTTMTSILLWSGYQRYRISNSLPQPVSCSRVSMNIDLWACEGLKLKGSV
jgi:hypothetical protein